MDVSNPKELRNFAMVGHTEAHLGTQKEMVVSTSETQNPMVQSMIAKLKQVCGIRVYIWRQARSAALSRLQWTVSAPHHKQSVPVREPRGMGAQAGDPFHRNPNSRRVHHGSSMVLGAPYPN